MIRWLRNFPIFLRTMVTVIVAVVAVLGIFAYLGGDALDQSTVHIQQMELRYAGLAAASIDSRLEDYFGVLALQGEKLAGGGISAASTRNALAGLEDTGLFAGGVFYLDDKGGVVDSLPALDAASAQALQLSALVQQAIQTKRRQTGSFTSDLNGRPQVVLLAPAVDPKGNVDGYVGGVVNLDSLTIREFMQLLAGRTEDRILLIDSGGIDAEIGTDGNLSLHPAADIHALQPYLDKRASGIALLDKAATHTADNVAAVFAPLSNAQWTVVVERPESEVFGLLTALRWQFVYFGGAILVLAILSVWLDEGLLLGPLRAIAASHAPPRGRRSGHADARRRDAMKPRNSRANSNRCG